MIMWRTFNNILGSNFSKDVAFVNCCKSRRFCLVKHIIINKTTMLSQLCNVWQITLNTRVFLHNYVSLKLNNKRINQLNYNNKMHNQLYVSYRSPKRLTQNIKHSHTSQFFLQQNKSPKTSTASLLQLLLRPNLRHRAQEEDRWRPFDFDRKWRRNVMWFFRWTETVKRVVCMSAVVQWWSLASYGKSMSRKMRQWHCTVHV